MREFSENGTSEPLEEEESGNVHMWHGQQHILLRQSFHAGYSYLNNLDKYEAEDQAYARSNPGPSAPSPSAWPYFTSEWGGAGSACRDTRRDWTIDLDDPLGLGALPRHPDGKVQLRLPTAYKGSSDELWSRDGAGTLFGQDVQPAQEPETTGLQKAKEEKARKQVTHLWEVNAYIVKRMMLSRGRTSEDHRRRDTTASCSAVFGTTPGRQDRPTPPTPGRRRHSC